MGRHKLFLVFSVLIPDPENEQAGDLPQLLLILLVNIAQGSEYGEHSMGYLLIYSLSERKE